MSLKHDLTILQNAADLGFDQEAIMNYMDPRIFEFASTLNIKEVYPHLFEKVVQYAETYICIHQIESFVKEIYHSLIFRRSFSFQTSDECWHYIDGTELIDWDKYKDCKDDDKIFFYSALDSDLKTVLKFYDLGLKRHLI